MKKGLVLWFMLLGLSLSAVGQDVPRGIYFGDKQVVAKFNDVVDIFGDNKALYDPEMNMLLLRDGFKYRLPEGFVSFNTGETMRIRLEGKASIDAAVVSKDPVSIESDGPGTLTIVSNGSTTALKCPQLTIEDYNTSVRLSSSAANKEMIALNCPGEVKVNGGALRMEVTNRSKAAEIGKLTLNGSVLETPKAVTFNSYGVVCDDKGRFVRLINIIPEP